MENNLLLTGVLILIELIYFRVANHFQIIDHPNERSSHSQPIIRGGGIIFLFAVVTWFFQSGFQWPWLMIAIAVIAVVSFLDDVTSLNPFVRFVFQLLAILLVFYQLWPIHWPWYLLVSAVVVTIGTLNAFNFMDGINGITGVYALVMLSTFVFVQRKVVAFTDLNLLLLSGLSVLVFLFFNFRKRARCFAGDVGSITMALILVFLLLQLIVATNNFLWPLLFLVYGVDSIVTILYRLKRRENIFQAHRTHLFQYLSNEMKIPHLVVSIIYGVVQGLLNIVFISLFNTGNQVISVMVALLFLVVYGLVRNRVVRHIAAVSR